MLMGALAPIPVLPRVVAKLRRVPQLPFGNPGAEAAERRIKFQGGPGYRVVAMAKSKKTPKLITA